MQGVNFLNKINPRVIPQVPMKLWQKNLKESIRSSKELSSFLGSPIPNIPYSVLIPKDLAGEILKAGENSPLWNQFVPKKQEALKDGMADPIGDHKHQVSNQLIHRYKNRILFLPTSACPVDCRYCFRKNELMGGDPLFDKNYKETLNYLKSHSEINEIIFSGGDPFMLTNEVLQKYLIDFSRIPHIKHIRFHTRTPIILPERFDEETIELLETASRFFTTMTLVVHTNHKQEWRPRVRRVLIELGNSKLQVLSQSVLLKNVNDDLKSLQELIEGLVDFKIRPYYLHHPDQTKGALHFYISLTEGRMLYSHLRNLVPGWALPQYMIDIPGGEGKTSAYNPESFDFSGFLINRDGELKST